VGQGGEPGAKASRTRWRALERFAGMTAVELAPESGRLHQIRAHLAAIGHPLVVDPIYGAVDRLRLPETAPGRDASEPAWLERTPLHALSVKLLDPGTGQTVRIEAPLPRELADAVAALRQGPVQPTPGG
jgi:23S rRNA-/tRNA-specific pseudouridylate synthase